MTKLWRWTAVVSGGLLLTLVVGAFAADRLLATEVMMIAPNAPAIVQVERSLWQPGQPVALIYGTPVEQPLRVLMVDQQRLIRPREDPRLLLLAVDKQRGDNPLQVKTMWFVVIRAAGGLGILLTVSVLGLLWRRGKGGKSASSDIQFS